MRTRKAHDGTEMPVIGLGTYGIGGGESADTSHDEEAVKTLCEAFDLGYRHVDTAEVYAAGHSEELVGRAAQAVDRENLFITTKVAPSHLKRDAVIEALEGSLARLRTEYIDLYLIHWPNESIELSESFEGLNSLVEQGKVRRLGVSNFGVALLDRAMAESDSGIVTNQVPYGIDDRTYERNGVLEWCREHGVIVTAYSPIKKGDRDSRVVGDLAAKYDVSPAQIALAWTVTRDPVIAIPKAGTSEHLKENLAAAEVSLEPQDHESLTHLHR